MVLVVITAVVAAGLALASCARGDEGTTTTPEVGGITPGPTEVPPPPQTVRHGDDTDPAWSPDGTRIAFGSNRDGDRDIYVMDADGGNVQQLTDDPESDRDPAWSPDGTRIAFTRNGDIYVMDADGGNVQLLTDGPDPTAPRVCSGGWLYCAYAEACWQGGGEVGINTANSACSHANMMKGGGRGVLRTPR